MYKRQDQEISRDFYLKTFEGEFPIELDFVQMQGPDLALEPHIAWDLEILEVGVPKDFDLAKLKSQLEAKGLSIYLDTKETVLVLSDPSLIEIWFMK